MEAERRPELLPGRIVELRQPDLSGDVLTVSECAERYGVAERTVRRNLGAGRYPGAAKQPTPTGGRWLIPLAAAERHHSGAGNSEQLPPAAESGQQSAELVEELRRRAVAAEQAVEELRRELRNAQAALTAGHDYERQRQEQLVEAERRAAAAEAVLEELRTQLAAVPDRRRRWFRRNH